MSRIRGVVANYLAFQARDPGISIPTSTKKIHDSIWHLVRKDIVFSCNLRYWWIFLHGCSQTYRVASLRITCTLIVNMCGMSLGFNKRIVLFRVILL